MLISFEELYARYERLVMYCVLSLLGDRETAEEAAQETWIKIWKAMPTLTYPDYLGSWVGKIARRTALDALKHRQLERKIFEPSSIEQLEEELVEFPAPEMLETHMEMLDAWEQIQQLPEGERKAIRQFLNGTATPYQRQTLYKARKKLQLPACTPQSGKTAGPYEGTAIRGAAAKRA